MFRALILFPFSGYLFVIRLTLGIFSCRRHVVQIWPCTANQSPSYLRTVKIRTVTSVKYTSHNAQIPT